MISETFLLGIDLGNGHVCHNLSLGGTLTSPECIDLFSPGIVLQSVRSVSLEALTTRQVEIGVVSPRLANRVLTPLLGNGTLDEIGAIEIAFEKARREIAPQAASRLCCIWLADDTQDGHAHIQNMFKDVPALFIIRVRIAAYLRLTRANTGWFDKYSEYHDEQFIRNYWQGVDCKNRGWEYLLEGQIQTTEANQIAHIKQHGAKLA